MAKTENESCCAPVGLELPRIFIDSSKCINCGICGEVCPFALPRPTQDGYFTIKSPEKCIECSACKRNCPSEAVIMEEQVGCGCLWDAKQRLKNQKDGKMANNACCGNENSPSFNLTLQPTIESSKDSCCGSQYTENSINSCNCEAPQIKISENIKIGMLNNNFNLNWKEKENKNNKN